MKATTSKWAEAKKSKIHGMGVFASRDIPKGEYVFEYVGEKITKKESDERADRLLESYEEDKEQNPGVFIFTLNKRYDIDGNVPWNTARWINHSCDPNCESDIEDGQIWIKSIRDIKKGEEIVYNYGYDVENYEDHPCWCGSKRCVGYIVDEDQWPKLKKLIKRKKDRTKRKTARNK